MKNLITRSLVDRVCDRIASKRQPEWSPVHRSRPLVIEALEPRVLFSGAPVSAPAEQAPPPPENPTAQEAPVAAAAPAEAAAPEAASEVTVVAAPEANVEIPAAAPEEGDAASADANTGETVVILTDSEVSAIAQAAVQRWNASGLTAEQSAALANISYQIADLDGSLIGSTDGTTITIDINAAGRGWFVDSTPLLDEEYSSNGVILLANGGDAGSRIDLLTALLHEQAHILGLSHSDTSGDLLFDVLNAGERRLPSDNLALGAIPGSSVEVGYLHAPALVQNTWSGAVDNSWNNAGNWSAGIPDVNHEAIFSGAGGSITVTGTVTVGALHFSTGTYTLTGGTINLGGPASIQTDASATISSNLGGSAGLTKSGAGTLFLNSATSNYTGGTIINAGQLRIASDAALGNASGSITLNGGNLLGNTTFPQVGNAGGVNIASARNVIVNVAGGSIGAHGNNNFTTTGILSGTGTLTFTDVGGAGGRSLNFNNTGNTFTGRLEIGSNSQTVQVNSLGDEVGAGAIALNKSANGTTPTFTYGTGATTGFTLNNRVFEVNSAVALTATINNLNTTQAITVNTDLIATGAGAKTLTLSAATGPINVFAGDITNGTGSSTISLLHNSGNWELTGNNTYSGDTLVNVTLTMRGTNAVSPNTIFRMGGTDGSAGNSDTIRIFTDDAGTVNLGNQLDLRSVQTSATANWVVNVGNNGGVTTGSTIALGKVNFAFTTDNRANGLIFNTTGTNGYKVQVSDIDVSINQANSNRLNPTTAPLIVTGTVKQINGKAASYTANGVVVTNRADYLELDGTASGNLISGVITDATDFTNATNPNAQPLNIVKRNSSVWSLSNTNTYSGATYVNGGTLIINDLQNGGVGSSIGKSSGAFNNLVLGTGTLQYAPISGLGATGSTTDRNFALTGNAALDSSGTGALVFDQTGTISPDITGQSFTTTSGNNRITGLSSTAELAIGMRFTGTGVAANATITSIDSASQITVSANSTASGSAANGNFGYGNRTLTLTGTNTDANTIAGALQDSSSTGAGVLTLAKSGDSTWVLSGANTYTGNTIVNGGTLQFATQESLYNNTPANWTAAKINVKSGATLALNVDSAGTAGFTDANLNTLLTNISVAGSATAGLQSGATLGFDTGTATGGTFTQGNAIANSTGGSGGAIGVAKLGTGTLVLDKANTYTGATAVNGGTLTIASTGNINTTSGVAIAGGDLNYNSATALTKTITFGGTGGTLSGTGTINTAVNITSGNTLAAGTGGIGTLTLSAIPILAGTVAAEINKSGATLTADKINVAAALTYGGTLTVTASGDALAAGDVFDLFDATSFAGSFGTINLPTAPSGTEWDTSQLTVDGTIRLLSTGSLSAILDGSNNLVITDTDGTGKNNRLTISNDGSGNIVISDAVEQFGSNGGIAGASLSNGNRTLTVPLASIAGTNIIVNAALGNDSLTASLANSLGKTLDFNGGAGGFDSLILSGGTTTTQTFNFLNENDGSVVLAGAVAGTINYTGLEPITSTINATNVTLNYSAASETITVTDAGGGQTTVDSNIGGEIVTFNNPTGTLTINAGDGNDIINLNGLASNYAANVTISGEGGTDSINIGGAISFAGNLTLDAETITQTAALSGAGTLIKTGAGTMTLSQVNTYTGGTNIGGGTLSYGNKNALGSGTVTLAGGTTITKFGEEGNAASLALANNIVLNGTVTALTTFGGLKDQWFSGQISGSGGWIVTGDTRSITFTGNNSYTGGTILQNGTAHIQVGHVNALGTGTLTINKIGTGDRGLRAVADLSAGTGVTNNISISAGATLNVGQGSNLNLSGVISGSNGVLNKIGTNTLTLSGTNTYGGLTNITSGTVKIGNAAALGAQTGTSDGTIISSGASLDLGGIGSGASNQAGSVGTERITASGAGVGGNGAIFSSAQIPTNFIGVRHLTLAGDTTLGFTNRWDVGSNNAALPSSLVGNGHTLNLIGSGAGQASFNHLGATDLGDININLGNTGIVYLQGSTNLGRTGYTVTISGGSTLDVFTNSTVTTFDKKFALNTGNITIEKTGAVSLPGTISLTGASNTITANSATVAITAGGVISGTGALTKAGAGTLTLSNANTYTGATAVNAGTLVLGHLSAIASNATNTVSVTSGAMLQANLGGTYTNTAPVTIAGTGVGANKGALDFSSGGITSTVWSAPIVLGGAATIHSFGVTMSQTLNGAISGTGPLTIASRGGSHATHTAVWTLNAASTYSGNTTIFNDDGLKDITVKLGIANALPTGTSLNLSAVTGAASPVFATLDLNGFSQTLGGLTDTGGSAATGGTSNKRVINSSAALATLTINNPGAVTYGTVGTRVNAGTIGGTTAAGVTANNLALVKTGAGTFTLGGANTYTGATAVNQGVLELGNVAALSGTSGITLGGGTTLRPTVKDVVIDAPITLGGTGTTAIINASTAGTGGADVALFTLNGAIGGAGNLTFNGSANNNSYGTIVLNGQSTYTGSTLLTTSATGATLFVKAGIDDALPTTTVLTLDGGNGAGTGRTLSFDLGGNDQTLAGLTNNTTRTLRNQRVTNTGAPATLTINNATAFTYGGSFAGTTATSAQITGAIALTKDGAGTFTLAPGVGNTYTGDTIVNQGTLAIGHSNSLGTTVGNTTTINGNDGTTGATLSLSSATSGLIIAEDINFFGNTAGRAQLVNNSAQNHILSGNIDVTSDTNHVQFSVTANSAATPGGVTISGDITGTMTNGASLLLRGGTSGGVSAANFVTGDITLTGGGVFKTDSGTWTIGATGKTYSAPTIASAVGTLKMGSANYLTGAPELILGNSTGGSTGVFDLNGFDQTVGGLTYNGHGTSTGIRTITNSGAAATLTAGDALDWNQTGTSPTDSIVLTGNLVLIKVGTGSLTLVGASTYNGGTAITDGTLLANNVTGSATGGGNIQISAGGTLGGNGTVSGAVTSAGGTISAGDMGTGRLSTGSLTLDSASTAVFGINGTGAGALIAGYDQVKVTGGVDLGGATLTLLPGYLANTGDTFIIIDNDGMDMVNGTFLGLAEGATFFGAGSLTLKITYKGGDGNDVVLTAIGETGVALVGGDLVVTDINGDDTNDRLTITSDGSNVIIRDPNQVLTSTVPGSMRPDLHTVVVPFTLFDNLIIRTGGGDDIITLGNLTTFKKGLTVEGGAGFDLIQVGSNLTGNAGASYSLTAERVNFQVGSSIAASGSGSITVSGTGGGTGVGQFGFIYEGVKLKDADLSTVDGNIVVGGQGGADATANVGIQLSAGSTIRATGAGSVSLVGQGGTLGSSNAGLSLIEGSVVSSGAAGGVTIIGTGGGERDSHAVDILHGSTISGGSLGVTITGTSTGTGVRNDGVYVVTSTVSASGGGSVTISGTGSQAAPGGGNAHGVRLSDGTEVSAAGAGGITLAGVGGTGSGSGNEGVHIGLGTSLTTAAGNIVIDGTGTGTGSANYGVNFLGGSSAKSGGALTIAGTGGAGTYSNAGVSLSTAALSTTGGGALGVTGTGRGVASGYNNVGIIGSGSTIGSLGGTLTLNGTGGAGTTTNQGIRLTGGSVTSSGGNIDLDGRGTGTGTGNSGVTLTGVLVQSTGAGNVSIDGTGGSGTANNVGVDLLSNARVLTSTGTITLTGTGNGSSYGNRGIVLANSRAESSGGGAVTLEGRATTAAPAGYYNDGISLSSSRVGSAGGTLAMRGFGGSGSNANNGIKISGGSLVGLLDLDGTALAGTTGSGNAGITIQGADFAEVTGGTIDGTGGGGTGSNHGVYMNGILGKTKEAMFPGTVNGTAGGGASSMGKVGNFFNFLPALLAVAAAEERSRKQVLGSLMRRILRDSDGIPVYREEDGAIGLDPAAATVETLEEAGIYLPAAPEGTRAVVLLTGDDHEALAGFVAFVDADGEVVSSEPLDTPPGMTVAGLLNFLAVDDGTVWTSKYRTGRPLSFCDLFAL